MYKFSIDNALKAFPEKEWRVYPEYDGIFCVSYDGCVYSCRTGKLLKTRIRKEGHVNFSTRIGGRKGIARRYDLHRLVALLFVPNPHNKPFVNHIDAVKVNNSPNNLEWVTNLENLIHARDLGLLVNPKGEYEGSQIISIDIFNEIKRRYSSGCRINGGRALEREFGISRDTIERIAKSTRV